MIYSEYDIWKLVLDSLGWKFNTQVHQTQDSDLSFSYGNYATFIDCRYKPGFNTTSSNYKPEIRLYFDKDTYEVIDIMEMTWSTGSRFTGSEFSSKHEFYKKYIDIFREIKLKLLL